MSEDPTTLAEQLAEQSQRGHAGFIDGSFYFWAPDTMTLLTDVQPWQDRGYAVGRINRIDERSFVIVRLSDATRALLRLLADAPEISVPQLSSITQLSEEDIEAATLEPALFDVDVLGDIPASLKLTDRGRQLGRWHAKQAAIESSFRALPTC